MSDERKIQICLLLMRCSIAAVFLAWTIKKLAPTEGTVRMMSHYFLIDFNLTMILALGIIELGLLLLFLSGKFRNWTYAAILFAHTLTTLASSKRFLPPYEDHALLYLTTFPLLAACLTLYLLREKDTLFTLK